MGKLLSGGRYQADNGLVYGDYQSAVNAGQVGEALQRAGSGILWGLTHPVELANKYEAARKSGFGFGRPAAADTSGKPLTSIDTGKYGPSDWNKAANPNVSSTGTGGRLKPPITSPNTTFQHADDEYNRLKAQYGGAPGVEQLAMQTSLPTGFTPTGAKGRASLKDFYSAESQVGGRDIESIIGQMGYKGPMAEWAKANPMLAQREYAKKMSAGQAAAGYAGTGPSDEAIRSAISGGTFFPSTGSPSPIANPPQFGTPANAVPAPPTQQGAAVSAPFKQAQEKAAEKTGSETGMPNLPTTTEKTTDFFNQLGSSPWGQALMNTVGGIGIRGIQGLF